jgi:hypothetical protein
VLNLEGIALAERRQAKHPPSRKAADIRQEVLGDVPADQLTKPSADHCCPLATAGRRAGRTFFQKIQDEDRFGRQFNQRYHVTRAGDSILGFELGEVSLDLAGGSGNETFVEFRVDSAEHLLHGVHDRVGRRDTY